jgi:SdpI/YfhL protein family
VALVVVAVLSARSVLRRNRWVGVRTAATLASETQFVAGNRAAAMPVGAAGVVAGVGGAFLLVGGSATLNWVVLTISLLAVLGLTVFGGSVGARAAALTPAPAPFAATCGGACAGCDLVAGCREARPDA